MIKELFFKKKIGKNVDETGISSIRNLDDLLKILAFLIMADEKFSDQESKFIRDYFNEIYPEFVEEIEETIEKYAKKYISFESIEKERILERLRASMDLDEKLSLLVTLFTLIDVDGIDENEIKAIEKLAEELQITHSDFDFVYFMHDGMTLKGTDPREFENNFISIGSGSDKDLFFPGMDGTAITFYKIHDMYYIKMFAQANSNIPVSLNNFKLPSKMLARFSADSRLNFLNTMIDLDDVKNFLKNKATGYDRTVSLDFDGNRVLFRDADSKNIKLKIMLNRNRIKIFLMENINVRLGNEELMPGNEYMVNYYDNIVVNGLLNLNIKKLILQERKEIELKKKDSFDEKYMISNFNRDADFFIEDELDEEIDIEIAEKKGKYLCTVLKSPFTLFIDDEPVEDKAYLKRNSRISIGKTLLQWDMENKRIELLSTNIKEVRVDRLSFKIKDKLLIDEVSFSLGLGDMVCIIGPSGSGKSTLLSLLCGYYRPSSGSIKYNGYDLNTNLDSLKSYIGFVPQDDLLFANLTVYENMYYRAKIVNPYMEEEGINSIIDGLLLEFGLHEVKNLRVGNPIDKTLSGGQRKRLNIALEILNDPDVLYLDEPTSGLSSKDSEIIIQYLSRLSSKGKIIVSTIHQPSPKIYRQFNRLLMLDKGGKLAYFGAAFKGIEFFKEHSRFHIEGEECPQCGMRNPEILLSVMEEPLIDLQGRVVTRDSSDGIPVPLRKYSPDYWKRLFIKLKDRSLEEISGAVRKSVADEREELAVTQPVKRWMQFLSVFSRNIINKFKSKTFLKLILIQSPLLALFLAWILKFKPMDAQVYTLGKNHFLPYFIFLSIISILFIAFSNSIDEIVSERPILFRERMLNIKNWIFYLSKFITLSLISIFQVIIFCVISFPILEIEWFLFPWYFFILFLVSLNGITLGLAISSFVKNSVSNIIPLILIPQIILGGALIPFKELTGTDDTPVYSHLLTSKWAYEALMLAQAKYNKYTYLEKWANEPSPDRYERREELMQYWKSLEDNKIRREDIVNEAVEELVDNAKSKRDDKHNIFLADKVNMPGNLLSSLALDIMMLCFFTLIMTAAAILIMRRKDRKL